MHILATYLRRYWKLGVLALGLAAVNQIFSLLDPLVFRYVIDEYATRYKEYTTSEFLRGVSLLLAAAVGVAFVSRVAKNFQDYYVNVITQRLGAVSPVCSGAATLEEEPWATHLDRRRAARPSCSTGTATRSGSATWPGGPKKPASASFANLRYNSVDEIAA